ncbi:MAG: peroxiredoxin [Paracoccaceae bacterium]
MTISVGDKVPTATLIQKRDGVPAQVSLDDRLAGRKVVIFGLPGAFTPTCSAAHVPSFIRTIDQFKAKGVDEIICIAVNDMHVMDLWGKQTGGTAAGITFLADGDSSFTKAIGMDYDNPVAGMHARCKRFAMYVEDGVVKVMSPEIEAGVCDLSGGEYMLEQI